MALNDALEDRRVILPKKFNFIQELTVHGEQDQDRPTDSVIVHYANRSKPWTEAFSTRLYQKYYGSSPWKGFSKELVYMAAQASAIGADAVLIQDLGVLRMLRQTAPDLPVHASTQMTLHNLDGVKMAADLGLTRAVLSRELSRDQIESICQRAPIEIEVFAHGALCMCYSGQCFLSSVIGGRSGNRGLCAQPCRLKYGWNGKADGNPLSLKDMSMAGHIHTSIPHGCARQPVAMR